MSFRCFVSPLDVLSGCSDPGLSEPSAQPWLGACVAADDAAFVSANLALGHDIEETDYRKYPDLAASKFGGGAKDKDMTFATLQLR